MVLDQSKIELEVGLIPKKIINEVINSKEAFLLNEPGWIKEDYKNVINQVKSVYSKVNKKYKKLLVLGIGGSALGTSSALDFLYKSDNVVVLDTIDPYVCEKIFSKLNFEDVLINAISKSGSTLETLAQFSYIKEILLNNGLKLKDHIVVTTGKTGELRDFALENDLLIMDVPEDVGGRFSVFTQVGLFPLYFAGVNIDDFVSGMNNAIFEFKNNDFDSNIPLKLSVYQYYVYKFSKKNISVMFTYSSNIIKLIEWYKQLLSESIGKNENVGITPISSFGSTDQHSQLQLFLDGPRDKFFTFINTSFSSKLFTGNDFKYLKSKSFGDIQNAFFAGTKESFDYHKIGYQEINIKCDEKDLASFYTNFMISIGLLGILFSVNAYDQRAVEYGKIKSKEILIK